MGYTTKCVDKLHLLDGLTGDLQKPRIGNHKGEAPCARYSHIQTIGMRDASIAKAISAFRRAVAADPDARDWGLTMPLLRQMT